MKRKRKSHASYNSAYNNIVDINPHKHKRISITPKNKSQEIYLTMLAGDRKHMVFAVGPAGTGKTMIAVQHAINQFKDKLCQRIVITRPAVSVDENHGFLPGDLNQKMEPWTRPIFDVFADNFSKAEIERQIRECIVEVAPLAYMRGRTFKNAIIIADEMQNATASQMKMLLTRLGENSKMIVTGDITQADRPSNNGLLHFLGLYSNFQNSLHVDVCRFSKQDIERHPAVREILDIYGDD
jgi:phosphate starvation-inducible PhoH-like protein